MRTAAENNAGADWRVRLYVSGDNLDSPVMLAAELHQFWCHVEALYLPVISKLTHAMAWPCLRSTAANSHLHKQDLLEAYASAAAARQSCPSALNESLPSIDAEMTLCGFQI